MTDYDAVKAAVDAAGPVDILVNNAGNAGAPNLMGSFDTANFVDTTPDTWDRYVKINYYGVLNCVHVALPGMIEGGLGSGDHADLRLRARRRPAHRGVRRREGGGGGLHALDRARGRPAQHHRELHLARGDEQHARRTRRRPPRSRTR